MLTRSATVRYSGTRNFVLSRRGSCFSPFHLSIIMGILLGCCSLICSTSRTRWAEITKLSIVNTTVSPNLQFVALKNHSLGKNRDFRVVARTTQCGALGRAEGNRNPGSRIKPLEAKFEKRGYESCDRHENTLCAHRKCVSA
jgi:hypothetical protein